MRRYQLERAMNYTEMTYEEWLGTYGVSTQKERLNEPELIRYIREWQYPSNTVEPSTGVPSSAVSWVVTQDGRMPSHSITHPVRKSAGLIVEIDFWPDDRNAENKSRLLEIAILVRSLGDGPRYRR